LSVAGNLCPSHDHDGPVTFPIRFDLLRPNMKGEHMPYPTPQPRPSRAPDTPPIWVTVNDAIRLSGIGRTRLYELIGDGTIQSIKVGAKRLIAFASITALGKAGRT
jgi:hypothetical protein